MRVGAPGSTFLAGEESAAGAPASSWLRWPRALGAGGGAWPGRQRSPSHWPFVLQLFPSLSGSPRPPAPLPRESLRFLGPPAWGPRQARRTQPVQGILAVAVPGGRRLREGQSRSFRVSAQWPPRAHVGSGRKRTTPRPWPPDKAVLEGAAKLLSAFLRGTCVGSESAKLHIVFPAGSGVCVCQGTGGTQASVPEAGSPKWATGSQRLWVECWGPPGFRGEGVIPDHGLPFAITAGLFFSSWGLWGHLWRSH